ncbi:MAG: Rieske 2Fe-2S domain-containing protein [Lachnospiraceae bacterium]
MYVDEAQKGMSFRNYENLLLIGDGDHRTGKNGGNYAELEDFAKRHYPCAKVKYRWATLLSDMISGKDNPYSDVFHPSRTILRPQLAVNGFETVVNFLTPTVPRCPHLGCALKWNNSEHTWDCPCHGSRFTKDGKLIDNPSTRNMF